MTKQDLANVLAERVGLSKVNAIFIIDHVVDIITDTLADGEGISLRTLGTWTVNDAPARQARNPKTGETVALPARKAIKFKTAQSLKQRLNG